MSNICENCNEKDTIISDDESGKYVCQNCGKECEGKIFTDENDTQTFEGNDGENKIQRVAPAVKSNVIGTTLLVRSNGKTKVYKKYSTLNKKQRGFKKVEKLLLLGNVNKSLIEETKHLYEKVIQSISMQGRKSVNIILGIFYYVCRKAQAAKTIKQISLMFNVEEREIKKGFNKIKSIIVEPIDKDEMKEIVENHITTYLNGKNKTEIKMLSFQINKNIIEKGLLEGKSPRTLAGMSLFLSYKLSNDNFNDEIEFFSFFSNKTTLKKSFDEIKNSLKLILPEKFAYNDSYFNWL
jgi:transcription initiation factor TFIIIB Brf1 subunit/transcription initiation factor TFIIB